MHNLVIHVSDPAFTEPMKVAVANGLTVAEIITADVEANFSVSEIFF